MSGKLQKEIHKVTPFDSLQQEVILNIVRTADFFTRAFEELLKPYNLSATQYNVLRILRGHCCTPAPVNGQASEDAAHDPQEGIPCKSIGEQMLTRDPDITRLLDRLEGRALIVRQRATRDRRIVLTRITPCGLDILKELDQPVGEYHQRVLTHMAEGKLGQLRDLLEQARDA